MDENTSPSPAATTETGLVRAHGLAALAAVGYVVLLGLAVAYKFHAPDTMGNAPWLTWGRMRYAHTQGVFFGWLGNAFLAFLYYAVPRLAERSVTSRWLGWLLFVVWNFALLLPGWVLVQTGTSQPLEWGEFPLVIDAVAVFALLLAAIQFVLPFLRTRLSDLYVSGWYIIGGLVFTLLAYPVGQLAPEWLPGARGATFSGLWIHDAIGLFVTPLALAIAYVVIPATTRRPIYSHFLSMVGFWLLFLVYPLNGTHHYVFSSIPMEAQAGAIVASVYLGVDVILVVTNLLLSLRGASSAVAGRTPLLFVWVGVVAYLVVSMQGSLQALMPINRFVHFTDWVIGHAHLAMIGFASFTAIGGLLHAWERLPGLRYNARAATWAFWLLAVGTALMVLDLTAAGLVQGQLWQSEAPWLESVRASQVFWLTRTLSGVPILLGFGALALSMLTGPVGQPAPGASPAPPPAEQADTVVAVPGLAWLRSAYVVTSVAGVGLFALSFVVLALWPNHTLEEQIIQTRPAHLPEPTASEYRGRAIYIREGCANCHTQLIRFTLADVRRFGVASQAWESERDYPQMWGTRRIGPDLTREVGRHSRDWHLAHLWNPRHVVPDSNMPPYRWLFEGSATRPTQEALDLVAYLDGLGRDARLAGRDGPAPLPGMTAEEEKQRGMFCDCAIPRTPGPAPLLLLPRDSSERERSRRLGAEVFSRECSGCHGADGRGNGPAAEALLPRPRDLTTVTYSARALSQILWSGVPGSSMPGWSDLSTNELRGLTAHVRSLGEDADRIPPADLLNTSEQEQAVALYGKNCSTCHGSDGGGNTGSRGTMAPAPTNFQLIRPALKYADLVLAEGIPGTSMPPWKEKLRPEERRLLARYIRSLYRPEGSE